MKIALLLAWYDEDVEMLERHVAAGVEATGADVVVALDGRYELFPKRSGRNSALEHAAISRGCGDVPLRLGAPREPWRDEMTKRTALFRLAEQVTTADDWLVIIDADVELVGDPHRLRRALTFAECDSAEITVEQADRDKYPLRCLHRAHRGIIVGPNHYTYTLPDGRVLWSASATRNVPALELAEDVLREIHHVGGGDRADRKVAYYRDRDAAGIEVSPCRRCGKRAVCLMLDDFRPAVDEETGERSKTKITGSHVEVCAECVPWYVRRNLLIAHRHRIDPAWAARPRNKSADFDEAVKAAAGRA